MKKIRTTVRVPRCWNDFLRIVEFDLTKVTSEKHTNGFDDPNPHYDDVREIAGTFPDGATFRLTLCSGQGNYYGGLDIHKRIEGQTVADQLYATDEGNVIEHFTSMIEAEVSEGPTRDWEPVCYILDIEWIGDMIDWQKYDATA